MKLNEAFAKYTADDTEENYEAFGKALLSFVHGATKQNFSGQAINEELEDIAGNSVIRVLEKLKSYRSESAFHNWVTTIVRNEGNRLLHKEAARMEQAFVGNESYEIGPSLNQKILLDQLISKLSPPERVLTQHKLAGLENEEIAKEMGIPIGTVGSRWNTIKERLKDYAGVE